MQAYAFKYGAQQCESGYREWIGAMDWKFNGMPADGGVCKCVVMCESESVQKMIAD